MNKQALLVVLALAAPAAADPRANAEALFRQGRDLMAKRRYAEACAAFDASQQLDPATTTLFNQADCREKNNQLASAWGLFVEAERQTRSASGDVGSKLHQVAFARASKLANRVSKLTVRVAQPVDGLVITRDGEPIARGEWNRELPIDGGTHAVVARIGDREVWSGTVVVAIADDAKTADVTITSQAAPPPPAPAVPVAPAPALEPAPAPVDAPPPAHGRLGATLATAGGALLLGGALGFELLGRHTYDDAKAKNDVDLWTTANHQRYVAEGLLAGGIAVTGIAIYLWLHDDGRESRKVVPTGNGVALVGRF